MTDAAPDDGLSALTARWIRSWALSRGMAYDAIEPAGRAWLAHVGSEVRTREYVIARPDADELSRLVGEAVRHAGSRLTVIREPDPAVASLLGALERVTHDEAPMTKSLVDAPADALTPADGLTIRERESDSTGGEGVVAPAR